MKTLKCRGERFFENGSGLDFVSLPHNSSQKTTFTDIRTNRAMTSCPRRAAESGLLKSGSGEKKIHIRFHCDSSRSSVVPEFYSKLRAMLLLILLHWLLISSLMSCQVHLSLSMEEKIAGQVSLNWSFSCRTECSPGTALWVFHRSVFKASNKEN